MSDVVKAHMGKDVLNHFVENLPEYKATTSSTVKTKMKDDAWEQWLAYIILKGCDQSKYGSVNENLVSQYSLGNDQYPRSVASIGDVLGNHRYDQRYHELKKKRREQQQRERGDQQRLELQRSTSFP